MNQINRILASSIGSFLKAFISSILTLIVANGNIYTIDWKQLVGAAVVSTLPLLINALNPEYDYNVKLKPEN